MGTGSRMFRKRVQWCWGIRPEIPPCSAKHHTVMADGTYMNHDWCLIVAIDGESGEVLGIQWCSNESKAAYMALFSRIPAPDVLITDGLRGAESACRETWPDTRIQRCLVHVQRNTRTDLTSRPRLEAGRELKKLSDKLTAVRDTEAAARWGEALNAWHIRWRDFIAERTYARDDPANPKASKQEWWWTHQELRRCYRRLEKLFREGRLFAFLDPSLTAVGPVARTTNRLEGGVNSVVKNVLRNPRTARGAHAPRVRMGVLHEDRAPAAGIIHSRRSAGGRESDVARTGRRRLARIRDRHRLERIPHRHAISQRHRLTPRTRPKAPQKFL